MWHVLHAIKEVRKHIHTLGWFLHGIFGALIRYNYGLSCVMGIMSAYNMHML